MPDAAFRLGFVPGVTPAKWVRTWRQRHELPLELVPLTHPTGASALSDGTVDAVLLRPPVDRGTVSAIPLYTEVAVVLAPKEDRKSTRLNSSHVAISYAVFCLKKKNSRTTTRTTPK